MIDLMSESWQLWNEPESVPASVADSAGTAENAQPRGLPVAEVLRMDCGNGQQQRNPQPIRNQSASHEPHEQRLSAESAVSADPEWNMWVAAQCSLLPEDRLHLLKGLVRLHPRLQQRLAERYVETWHAAADDEPVHHKRDNAGRRAANMIITQLIRGNEHV